MNDVQRAILSRVEGLRVYRQGGVRAPNKPLLLLLALGRASRGDKRLILFAEVEDELASLLRAYGPPRRVLHPEYAFWWLQSDKLWEVPNSYLLGLKESGLSHSRLELREKQICGGFPEPIYNQLSRNPSFLSRVAKLILDSNFPSSIHEDILSSVGISLSVRIRIARDPKFRLEVLRAYEYRCAICSYDLKLGATDFALEAAHIKWYQAGGPDNVNNGLALCAIHHKALDRGAVGLTDNLTVMISAELHGQSWVREWFNAFKGMPINYPTRTEWLPNPEYIIWHSKEVFRPPAKD